MVDEAQVLDALRAVADPVVGKGIVDLGMVVGVTVERGVVAVTLALPVPDYHEPDEVRRRVQRALAAEPGVESVEVDLRVMDDAGRRAFREALAPVAAPFMQKGTGTRVLGISSGKGGVGKSSTTVNLAVTLARLGHTVGLLDADVYGFSVPAMMGANRPPMVVDGLVLPPVSHGVRVMSMGFMVEDDRAIIWRGPMLHKALEQLLTDVHWGEPDFLLIDMPPGTGDVAISMAQYLPRTEVYVVTTPQPAAQRVAQRSAVMANTVKLDVRGVIENMSWFTGDDGTRYELFGSGGGASLAERLGVPLLGQVPLVPDLREGGDIGLPITVSDPEGEAAQAYGAIAAAVLDLAPRKIYKRELTIS